jgi:hypothetical protein
MDEEYWALICSLEPLEEPQPCIEDVEWAFATWRPE